MTTVINKVHITEEAVFDYEHCIDVRFRPSVAELFEAAFYDGEKAFELSKAYEQPMRLLGQCMVKADVEEYIARQNGAGRLLRECYFRCKYFGADGCELMLFLYRSHRLGIMQHWEIAGICLAEDWSEDSEECGAIRRWLGEKITESKKDDWVVEQQARAEADEILFGGGIGQGTMDSLSKEVRHAIMCGTGQDIVKAVSCFKNASKQQFGR